MIEKMYTIQIETQGHTIELKTIEQDIDKILFQIRSGMELLQLQLQGKN